MEVEEGVVEGCREECYILSTRLGFEQQRLGEMEVRRWGMEMGFGGEWYDSEPKEIEIDNPTFASISQ